MNAGEVKILLIGRNGQVGSQLQQSLAQIGEVFSIGRRECDVSNISALLSIINVYRPDVIVNASAYTDVDNAESFRGEALMLNSVVPSNLAQVSISTGALIVHYSTDYVFDGEKTGEYTEDDLPKPINIYGETKLLGELALSVDCVKSLIFRTSWVYGENGNNFINTIIRLSKEKAEINVVDDQYGTPTSASLIANTTTSILRSYFDDNITFPFGLYHLTAKGSTNWYEYALHVNSQVSLYSKEIILRSSGIRPVPSSLYPQRAKRPQNSRMDVSKLEEVFGIKLPDWMSQVSRFIEKDALR